MNTIFISFGGSLFVQPWDGQNYKRFSLYKNVLVKTVFYWRECSEKEVFCIQYYQPTHALQVLF